MKRISVLIVAGLVAAVSSLGFGAASADEPTYPPQIPTSLTVITASPVAETTTPAAETTTPAAETTTPAAETTTPAAETTTPAAETTTPAAETSPSQVVGGVETTSGLPKTGGGSAPAYLVAGLAAIAVGAVSVAVSRRRKGAHEA